MWECGLKHAVNQFLCCCTVSLPMWECGLKHATNPLTVHLQLSLPMWECGLKHTTTSGNHVSQVTPHVGVWIETLNIQAPFLSIGSLPMWECGLKRYTP